MPKPTVTDRIQDLEDRINLVMSLLVIVANKPGTTVPEAMEMLLPGTMQQIEEFRRQGRPN